MQPALYVHETTGQSAACLDGLVRYAQRVAGSLQAGRFEDARAFRLWVYRQPVKLDLGEGPAAAGCDPPQRSRMWPTDGYNCWEATAHYVGIALRRKQSGELHLYDTPVNGQRHVFPAWRAAGDSSDPEPIILQPPLLQVRGGLRALRAVAQAIPVPWPMRLIGKRNLRFGDDPKIVWGLFERDRRGPWLANVPLPPVVLGQLPPVWSTFRGHLAPMAGGGWAFAALAGASLWGEGVAGTYDRRVELRISRRF